MFNMILNNTSALNTKINTIGDRNIQFEEKVVLDLNDSNARGLFAGSDIIMMKYIEKSANYSLYNNYANAVLVYIKNTGGSTITITINGNGSSNTATIASGRGMLFMNKQAGNSNGEFVVWA